MNILIADTETTGLKKPIKACQIGWIHVDENCNILDAQEHLTDPQAPIDPGATAIHGFTNEQVAGKPSNAEICALMPQPFIWIGHNVQYDQGVIAEHLVFSGEVCTLAASRRWVKGTTNHKLQTLRTELGLSEQKAHSALGDCYTALELLKRILDLSGRDLKGFIELESQPKMLPVMIFGEHRGKSFDKIPPSYIKWLSSLPDLHRDLRYTLDKIQLLRPRGNLLR